MRCNSNLPTESAINGFSGFGSTLRSSTILLIKLWVLRAKAEARTCHTLLPRDRRDMGTKLADNSRVVMILKLELRIVLAFRYSAVLFKICGGPAYQEPLSCGTGLKMQMR